jgi:predicted nucleic acid-binding protein
VPARYVLDASAGVEILQRTRAGLAIGARLRGEPGEMWTAEHFHLEVAKVFRRDVLAGVLTEERAEALVEELVTWPLFVASVAPLLREAWTLRHNVTIHDAIYVTLTRQLDEAVLVTTDTSLSRAPGLGIETVTTLDI